MSRIVKKTLLGIFSVLLLFILGYGVYHFFFEWKPLYVLVTAADLGDSAGLHRIEMPIDRERSILESFAREHRRKIHYIPVSDFNSLFLWLKRGRGDLVSANLSVTDQRTEDFLLSEPFNYTREILFTSSANTKKGTPAEILAGRTGKLLPGTSYIASYCAFLKDHPGLSCRILPKTISHDALIEQVCSGKIDYSILNESDLDSWLSYRTGIRKLCPVREHVPIVFAARKDSGKLIRELNAFIKELEIPEPTFSMEETDESLADSPAPALTGHSVKEAKKTIQTIPVKHVLKKTVHGPDLDQIKKRGYIRMLTSNDVFTCYLKQGQLYGFEYELAKRFADSLNVKLVTVIPEKFESLTSYLEEGRGDFIAVNFTKNPDRVKAFPYLKFCASYHGAVQVLAGRPGEKIKQLSDLNNRRIYVRKGSSYYMTLHRLQEKGFRFTIVPVPEHEPTLAILHKVSEGRYDLTVADDNFLTFAINGGCELRALLPLSEKEPFAWLVRKNNPKLEAAINRFFKKEYKSAFYNLCVKRYYSQKSAVKLVPLIQQNKTMVISPYDNLFQKYGALYQFHWYFLAAQSYQESRFKADTVNSIGACGLMQMMPKTAKEMGIENLKNPENSIHAGAKYMAKLRSRFPAQTVAPLDQLCFTLASYNAGYGHVMDARILASQLGLNPNIWFKNTEKALSLLENPQYAARAKYGFCRASETIPYVQNIILQTQHYQELLNVKKKKEKLRNEKR